MNHEEIFECFKSNFPGDHFYVVEWFPNGKNSIRIRRINDRDYVFTYNGQHDWCYETVESFIRKMKGGPGMVC